MISTSVGDGGDGPAASAIPPYAWAGQADARPGASTVAALDAADPTTMPGADLMDAIVACERAISHLQATQAALTAAFARPGIAGDLTGLTDNLIRRTGAARGPDGRIDPDLLAAHQQDYARSLASAEVAAALRIPHRTATNRVTAALDLVDHLPLTWKALHDGDIDARRATLIADGTRCLPGDLRSAAERVIVPLAGARVSGRVKELLERAVIAADPDAAARRERDARARRYVHHRPGPDGTGDIHAHLHAEGAVTVFTLLDLVAQAATGVADEDGTPRDIDARRADALTDIAAELLATGRIDLTGYGQPGTARTAARTDRDADNASAGGPPDHSPASNSPAANSPSDGRAHGPAVNNYDSDASPWRGLSRHGRRPHLCVTIGMSTLAGLDRLPGHLTGHGAITAELAITIARAYQTLTLAGIDHATGTAVAASATVYRPHQDLADQINTVATHCRFPSCRQPSWRSDHDHRVPFDHTYPGSGGLTTLWDCDPECRRHHLFKTHAQWNAEGRADRTICWTSPTGHRYVTRPTEYRLPGEDTDIDIAELILPATWPPPAPEPITPADGGSDSSGEHHGDDDCSGDRDGRDGRRDSGIERHAIAPPSPAMRRHLEQMLHHDRQLAQFRAVAHRARFLLARCRTSVPDDAPPATDTDRPVTNLADRRRPTSGDRNADLAVDRAMRRTAGLPDPDDEPPPF